MASIICFRTHSRDLHRRLKMFAASRQKTLAEVLTSAAEEYLDRKEVRSASHAPIVDAGFDTQSEGPIRNCLTEEEARALRSIAPNVIRRFRGRGCDERSGYVDYYFSNPIQGGKYCSVGFKLDLSELPYWCISRPPQSDVPLFLGAGYYQWSSSPKRQKDLYKNINLPEEFASLSESDQCRWLHNFVRQELEIYRSIR